MAIAVVMGLDLPYAALMLLASEATAPLPPPVQLAQVTIRQSLVVRVPVQPPPRPQRWRMGKGPRCLPMESVAGASLASDDAVDFILRDGARFRADMEQGCDAAVFYGGFYISPTEDRRFCAVRDLIRSRAGGSCGVTRFRAMTAER